MSTHPFIEQVGIELKRAERYRIFMSLVVMDLSFAVDRFGERAPDIIRQIGNSVRRHIRVCDDLSIIDNHSLVLMLPETPRQGAEISGKRIVEKIKEELSTISEQAFTDIIHMEMASYPDAAGAKNINAILQELSEKHKN